MGIESGKEQHLSIVLLVLYIACLRFYHSTPEAGGAERAAEAAHWGWGSATIILAVLALITAPVADAFVAVLEPTAKTLGLPELFLGLVIVPLVGNIP